MSAPTSTDHDVDKLVPKLLVASPYSITQESFGVVRKIVIEPTTPRGPAFVRAIYRITANVLVILTFVIGGGCGPSNKPTRFTPALVEEINRPRSDNSRPSASDRSAPMRNIEMH